MSTPSQRPTAAPSSGPTGDSQPLQSLFVVKLRDTATRSWGDQIEVPAASAMEAAEQVAGETLLSGAGDRANLRARVWPTPYGSQPDILFYCVAGAA